MDIKVRTYKEDDAHALASIYYHTIHSINIRDYSEEQVNAWAPYASVENYSGWQKKLAKIKPFVATINETTVGFAEFESNGHIDCFYVHHEFQGKGIGSTLMKAIFDAAQKQNIDRIYAEVSITAKPFFEGKGFSVVKEQTVTLRGVELNNFVMEKL
jgi:putative acetyltransferase